MDSEARRAVRSWIAISKIVERRRCGMDNDEPNLAMSHLRRSLCVIIMRPMRAQIPT